jgi:hypothetical protein
MDLFHLQEKKRQTDLPKLAYYLLNMVSLLSLLSPENRLFEENLKYTFF